MTPSSEMMPARYISATTSMMAEPQMPVTPVAAAAVLEARLVRPFVDADDAVFRLQRDGIDAHALDRAGCGALAATEISAPSKAGPVGEEAATTRSRLPSTISALVPTSTSSIILSWRCGPSDSVAPAASAPTWPAMQGSM